ncbi:MAG: TIGR00730 family Rossman fold protein [Proteobacteria bacterium]|nr:TIGR00730 family Rossman fold protein [Pseudomonadota bacterium]
MRICLFSAASAPHTPAVAQATQHIGTWLGSHGHTLISGGAGAGMMQLAAEATLNAGGKVFTIYPETFLAHEKVQHPNLTHTTCKNLHDRLDTMCDMADAFIALPGGIGTLHEIAQVWADMRCGFYSKPLHLLNLEGFFDPLLGFMQHVVESNYAKPEHLALIQIHPTVESLLTTLARA